MTTLFNNPFLGMPNEKLLTLKRHYERLIFENSEKGFKKVKGKIVDKHKMPWMLNAWQCGLYKINEVLKP